jgi:hypothetical protein
MGFIHEGCILVARLLSWLQINQHVENRNRQEQREPCHQASLAGAIADSDHCPRKTRHALAGLPPTRDAGVASLRAVPSLGRLDRHFTLPSPSTPIQIFHPIRRDVRRGGCDDRCPLPPIHGKPDALLLREHYPLLPVGHARTFLGEK